VRFGRAKRYSGGRNKGELTDWVLQTLSGLQRLLLLIPGRRTEAALTLGYFISRFQREEGPL
jgi:hypothetical protein